MIYLINGSNMDILITTPSLNPTDNVSGISSMVRLLMQYNTQYSYHPFILGKKDGEKRGLIWLFTLLKMPFSLYSFIRKNHIKIAHFNLGLEPPSLLRDIIPYMLLFNQRIPLCLHIHGGRYISSVPDNFLLRWIIKTFLKKSSEIIVLSRVELNYLKSQYDFLDSKRIHIIPNAIEIPDIKVLSKDFSRPFNILYLGRIDRKKGLHIIADSLNELVQRGILFKFYLCGVGPDKDWFMSLLSERAVLSVVDQGLVFGKKKDEILKLAHLFLLPSSFEGLPMALLESMGYGVLPLVSPVGSMPDVVEDGKNGFLIENAKSIVSTILLLDQDRVKLEMMAQAARETMEDRFSIKNYVNKVNAVYPQF